MSIHNILNWRSASFFPGMFSSNCRKLFRIDCSILELMLYIISVMFTNDIFYFIIFKFSGIFFHYFNTSSDLLSHFLSSVKPLLKSLKFCTCFMLILLIRSWHLGLLYILTSIYSVSVQFMIRHSTRFRFLHRLRIPHYFSSVSVIISLSFEITIFLRLCSANLNPGRTSISLKIVLLQN